MLKKDGLGKMFQIQKRMVLHKFFTSILSTFFLHWVKDREECKIPPTKFVKFLQNTFLSILVVFVVFNL